MQMKLLNTKLVLSALAVAMLATPAFAEKQTRQSSHPPTEYQGVPSDDVLIDGRVIGADPDAQIRSQLSREWSSRGGD
jgi:hypothetical protein